jgi:hypothetical protein
MSNLMKHAKRELAALGMGYEATGMDADMRDHILTMVEMFELEGHSGFSASYAAGLLNKLFRYEPLIPLQGTDDEWNDVSDSGGRDNGPLFQNNRCSHVFKDSGGAYDIDGKVFVESDGFSYTNCESRVPVTFPYTPKTEYVDVSKKERY